MSSEIEIEPGAAKESFLTANDVFDGMVELSSSLDEIKGQNQSNLQDDSINNSQCETENLNSVTVNNSSDDFSADDKWILREKHIFVLSSAGKPVYSRYGNEDKLAWLFGVMQTLVSFVQSDDDNIKSFTCDNVNFVFLAKKPLILVAISRTNESTSQLMMQLNYVYNQIASVLTTTRLVKIYEQRQNYDLRRLLTGVERLIHHLLNFSETEVAFLLGGVQCLALNSNVRSNISSAIISSCNKIKNLVFAILIANNKLITIVRMKKYSLHPADIHLIFNLVQSSESLKSAESWTPLCLPRFDSSGFLYGHVSYLADDCQACLLLLTVERDKFYVLSEAKQKIVEKLRRTNCLEAINDSLNMPQETAINSGFSEVRHYLYKSKTTVQFYQPSLSPPYSKYSKYLSSLYKRLHQRLHANSRPLKLYFERLSTEAIFAWDTLGFELYVIFEPLVETGNVVNIIGRLLNWLKEREDNLFHLHVPDRKSVV